MDLYILPYQEKLIDMHMHPLIAWRKIDKETGL